MIFKYALGLSLVWNISLHSYQPPPSESNAWMQMSARQREAALLPLVRRATACIVSKAASDPRYGASLRPDVMNDLIVDSIAACGRPVRAMINVHDRMYGSGSGEAFLLGPYLDVLPAAATT